MVVTALIEGRVVFVAAAGGGGGGSSETVTGPEAIVTSCPPVRETVTSKVTSLPTSPATGV